MKKKIVWLLVSCLVVLSLVLASCAPAVTEEKKREVPVVKEEKKAVVVKEQTEKMPVNPEMPRYGGTVIVPIHNTGRGFDDMYQLASYMFSMMLTNEELTRWDWSRGLSGTGEFTFNNSIFSTEYQIGAVLEGWEFPEPSTIIMNVRQGIHFGLDPSNEASRMVGGREFVAEDVAYSIRRAWSAKFPKSWLGRNYPGWLQSVEATDKYTVVIKGDDNMFRTALVWERLSDYLYMIAPEVVEKYGDMSDWRNAVGTGPFFLTDYVGGSSFTFTRNPDYWMKDPAGLGEGNQLPYVDNVKYLVVSDVSTRLAGFRTGKLDALNGYSEVGVENSESLIEAKPELLWTRILLGSGSVIFMRSDLEPFNDIRVRQALFLAIDNPGIVENIYGGNAEVLAFPITPLKEFSSAYTPVEELPEATRELYEYHPDKARQLLAEAGYPDGLKLTMPVDGADKNRLDMAQVYKAYWDDVGINVELQVLDTAAYNSIAIQHSYTGLIFGSRGFNTPYQASGYMPGHAYNRSIIDDPYINERIPNMYAFENIGTDVPAATLKEITQYALNKAWFQNTPQSYTYHIWWPWLKNHYGEYTTGFHGKWDWVRYIWIDQELKKEMGY